ncbi:hypothetical protein EAE96_004842 [Botrytis aclada]|nr:hypothetical protein EAE96_004842 [Botrytis aclada]
MDLRSVREAARRFCEKEQKLDILWNNAGIGGLGEGVKTVQGVEGHMGVNVLGPWYFARLLGECLGRARREAEEGSVRVVWTTSWMGEGRKVEGRGDFEYHTKPRQSPNTSLSHATQTYDVFRQRASSPRRENGRVHGTLCGIEQGDYQGAAGSRNPREDIYEALGRGAGAQLWEWCEEQVGKLGVVGEEGEEEEEEEEEEGADI